MRLQRHSAVFDPVEEEEVEEVAAVYGKRTDTHAPESKAVASAASSCDLFGNETASEDMFAEDFPDMPNEAQARHVTC